MHALRVIVELLFDVAAALFWAFLLFVILIVAECSRMGNEQHNPGKPLHWDRSKSGDEADALVRHLVERGTIDGNGIRHSAKMAWRALALLQKEIEAARDAAEVAAVVKPWRMGRAV